MTKEQFVQQQDAPKPDAEKAWEIAEGDEEQAGDLLREQVIWIKGRFSSSSNPVTGLFLAGLDLEKDSPRTVQGVVLSSDDGVDFSVNDSLKRFDRNLEQAATDSKKMNANTEQLKSILKTALKDPSSNFRHKLGQRNFSAINPSLSELFSREFDFKVKTVRTDVEIERPVHSEDGEAEAPKQIETVKMPCDVEVTPVGVPVANLQPGDEIFVSIGDVDRSDKNVKRQLEATADPETGMVKATLKSKRPSDAGTLRLEVRFSENVFGHISSGKDVSIRVPSSTTEKRKGGGSNETLEFLQENWIAVGTSVVVFILLVSLALVLFA